jgi:hypothetical protein
MENYLIYQFLARLVELAGGNSISIACAAPHLALSLMPQKDIPEPAEMIKEAGYTREVNDQLGNPVVSLYCSGQQGLYSLEKVQGKDLVAGMYGSANREHDERQYLFSLLFENVSNIDPCEFHSFTHLPTFIPGKGWLAIKNEMRFVLGEQGWQVDVGFLPPSGQEPKTVLATFKQESGMAYRPNGLNSWICSYPLRFSVRGNEAIPASLETLQTVWRAVYGRLIKADAPAYISTNDEHPSLEDVFDLVNSGVSERPLYKEFGSWRMEGLASLAGLPVVKSDEGYFGSTRFYTKSDYLGVVGYEGWQYKPQPGSEQPVLVMADKQPSFRQKVYVMADFNNHHRLEFETVFDPNLNVNGLPIPYYMLNEGHPYLTAGGVIETAKHCRLIIRAENSDQALEILTGIGEDILDWWKLLFSRNYALRQDHPVFSNSGAVSSLGEDPAMLSIWLIRANNTLSTKEKSKLTRFYKQLYEVSIPAINAQLKEANNCRSKKLKDALLSTAEVMAEERERLLKY